eukprot:Rmarinus@m.9604
MTVLLDERVVDESNSTDNLPPSPPTVFPFPEAPFKDDLVPSYDETVILLDWDDTLLSSTTLSQQGFRTEDDTPLPIDLQKQLSELEKSVIKILTHAKKAGHVYLITNAEHGWIEQSAQRYVPRVLDHIRKLDIRVLSARTTYEAQYPGPHEWKVQAFVNEVSGHCSRLRSDKERALNIVCIGDSISERSAAHAVAQRVSNTLVKTIKFVERPTVLQLREQLEMLFLYLKFICAQSLPFDINLVLDYSNATNSDGAPAEPTSTSS